MGSLSFVIVSGVVFDFSEERKDFELLAALNVFLQSGIHRLSFVGVTPQSLGFFDKAIVDVEFGWH